MSLLSKGKQMNYHKYYSVDVINGEGTRCTLFVAGCEHKCKGCYNKSTWKLDSGFKYTKELEESIIFDLKDDKIVRQGLSISGGDPLHPKNVPEILKLVKRVKKECPTKDIWVWTGYKKEELNNEQKEVLNYINVLIDGKFEIKNKDPKLLWRGSSNQIIWKINL